MKKSVVFVGCGALSLKIAQNMAADVWQLYGLRRKVDQLPEHIQPIQADMTHPDCPASWPKHSLDYLVVALAPNERSESAYRRVYIDSQRNLYQWLAQHQQPKRIFFVSSTAVYGQSAGEWVDEQSVTEPERWSGKVMLEAEQTALACGFPATIVRLAGIYGGRRQAFLQRVREGYHADGCSNRFTNRIHEQDAADLISHLIELDAQGVSLQSVYLGVDNLPVEQAEVVSWLQQQLGVESVVEKRLNPAGGSKRCSNTLAKTTGWQPKYSDYRQGYLELI